MKKIINIKNPIIILISFIIFTSLFTYFGYQEAKQNPNNLSAMQRYIQELNDSLINIGDLLIAMHYNNNKNLMYSYLAFDSNKQPFLDSQDQSLDFSVINNDVVSYISLNNLSYQVLKELSTYVASVIDQGDVMITFNYDDLTTSGKVITDVLTYIKINDNVLLNDFPTQTITLKLTALNTYFVYYNSNENIEFDKIGYSVNLDTYNYFEKFYQEALAEKKLDQHGYYEVIDPRNNPIEIYSYTDENGNSYPSKVRFSIQEMSGKYGHGKALSDEISQNVAGYLVWYEVAETFDTYTLSTYLTSHYYNYLGILFLLGIILFITNSQKTNKENLNVSTIIPKQEIIPKETSKIDLQPIIEEILLKSHNILIFRHLKVESALQSLIINGNHEDLTNIISSLYNFIINNSQAGDTILIKIIDHKVSFTNLQANYSKKDLKKLDSCLALIKAYHYHYKFNEQTLIFYKGRGK